jgi:hypothetical protein
LDVDLLAQVAVATSAPTLSCIAMVSTVIAFAVGIRHGRARWVDDVRFAATAGPYRSGDPIVGRRNGVPLLLRTVALACFACGTVFAPLLLVTLVRFRLDGLAALLAAGLPFSLAYVLCGWRILCRAPSARGTMRALAKSSALVAGALLALGGVHVMLAVQHEAESIEVSVVGTAFAIVTIMLAALLGIAERRCAAVLASDVDD